MIRPWKNVVVQKKDEVHFFAVCDLFSKFLCDHSCLSYGVVPVLIHNKDVKGRVKKSSFQVLVLLLVSHYDNLHKVLVSFHSLGEVEKGCFGSSITGY